jgi:murein DD-endopeptidase MepM/ murein hydrolase activator NlpD
MKKAIYLYLVFVLLPLLVACQTSIYSVPEISATIEVDKEFTVQPTQKVSQPPGTCEPISHIQGISTPLIITPTLVHTTTATQTGSTPVICSPLGAETISSLWEIISNPFDPPPAGREDHHHGVDFAYYRRGTRLSIQGEMVQSILPGIVAASIDNRLPYGNMVIIESWQDSIPRIIIDKFDLQVGESLYVLYAHMEQLPEVKIGQEVSCGLKLGTVGTTGYDIVNPHLHLETRIGPSNTSFASMAYYDTRATVDEMENYVRWRTSGEFRLLDPMSIFAIYLSSIDPSFKTPNP